MPEMPEVEIIRRFLADKVEGRRIEDVEIRLLRLIKWPGPDEFKAYLIGRTIERLDRRGKYLLFRLENQMVLVVHLRMTGRLYWVSDPKAEDRFTRIILTLNDGNRLLYADSRTLGTLYVMPEEELGRISGLASLGPEPLSADFTLFYFEQRLANRQGRIKALLLDQEVVSGLGNIYVDEALAVAGIHPERTAGSLNGGEVSRLFDAVNQVIAEGIADGGTTFRDYRNGEGKSGEHQQHLRVYGRQNQPCLVCGQPIVWKKVGGRGTHFCPNCQH